MSPIYRGDEHADELVTVATFEEAHDAALACAALEAAGIESVMQDENEAIQGVLASVEVQVRRSDLAAAREVLEGA